MTTEEATTAKPAEAAREPVKPIRYVSDAISRAIKELRAIEPLVGGHHYQHRYAVKHAADELLERQHDVMLLEDDLALSRQTETDLLDEIAEKRATIRRLEGGR